MKREGGWLMQKRYRFKKVLLNIMTAISVLLVAVCLTGCEEPQAAPVLKNGLCIIEAAESKTLVSSVNLNVVEYLYKAIPQFSGATSGTVTEWQHLSYGGSGEIGLLTQGKWTFEVKGVNTEGKTITTGSTTVYIEPEKENLVQIQMKTDPSIGTGTISYSVWTQKVTETGTTLGVYIRSAGGSTWKQAAKLSDKTTEENPRYTGVINNVQSGYHDLQFIIYDQSGAILGGEQVGVQVVAGCNTAVSGIIEPSTEKGMDITIKSMGYVHALLRTADTVSVEGEGRDRVAYIERDDVVEFTWTDQADATSIPNEFIWALDGEVLSAVKGKSYSVSFSTYGEHELSVIGIRRDTEGKAWDAGSAVIRIVVVKHMCEVTFLGNGGFYPDGTDTYILSQDTTTPEGCQVPGGMPYDGISPQKNGYRLTGWADVKTGKKVVDVAADGTVTFLEGYATKEPARSLRAQWQAGTYTFTVNWGANVKVGGTAVPLTQDFTIQSGEKMTMLNPSPVRIGFIFRGYTTEENGRGDTVDQDTKYAWGKNVIIYANWEYVPIEVGYYKSYSDYLNSAAPYKTTTVGSDLRYGSLPQPIRQGKVFKGWAHPEDIDGTQYETVDGHKYLTNDALKAGKSFVEVASPVTIYTNHKLVAVWGEGDIKISFNTSGATLTQKGQQSLDAFAKDGTGTYYKYGALGTMYGALPFTGIETEVRDGWEFMGWYDTASYSMRVYEVSAVSTMEDHTLYAKWEGKRLTVSLDAGNGDTYPDREVRFGGKYGELPEPYRAGYDFAGWFWGTTEITADSFVTTGDSHTLKAKWVAKKSSLSISPNGGTWSHPTEMTVDYDQTYADAQGTSGGTAVKFGDNTTSDKLKNPTRYGYDFAGWYDNPGGQGSRYKGTTVNKQEGAQTLYATWSAHLHKITFHYNWPVSTGEASTTEKTDIAFGSSYGTLPNPTVTGYTFNGWYTSASGGTQASASTKLTTDEDVTLYGRWSIQKIKISFYDEGVVCRDGSGASISPVEKEWNSTMGTLPVPVKTGYVFTGHWYVENQYDASGNPIEIKSDTRITWTKDITLYPTWEPIPVLVVIPYNATVSGDGALVDIDWSQKQLSCVTYKKTFMDMKSVNISGTSWTQGTAAASLPSWTRAGYSLDGWTYVISGRLAIAGNATTTISDYGRLDEEAKGQWGSLTPDRAVYMVPVWTEKRYNISFSSKLVSNGSITDASSAPIISDREASYGTGANEAMPLDLGWISTWPGYACEGLYKDAALTQKITASDRFGIEIGTPDMTNVTVYAKWVKTNVQFVFTTSDKTLYPDGSENILYEATNFFRGSGAGYASGTPGWYSFSGHVDGVDFSNDNIRIGNSSLVLKTMSGRGSLGTTITETFTAPADMNIIVTDWVPAHYTYRLKCPKCDGKGYTYIGYRSEMYNSENNDEYYYKASKMYDFCPKGCLNWTAGSWSGLQECNNTIRDVKWVTCPNCNGDPNSEKYTSSRSEPYTWTETIEHPAKTHTETWIEYDPKLGRVEKSREVVDSPAWTETVEHTGTTTIYMHNICYCNKFGRPGQVPLAGYARLGDEYGNLEVLVNGSALINNAGSARNGYNYNNGSLGTADMPASRSVAGCFGSSLMGGVATLSVKSNDTITIRSSLPKGSSEYIVATEDRNAYCKIVDDPTQYKYISLAKEGRVLGLTYDFYKKTSGKYVTTNGSNITEAGTTNYYSFCGQAIKKDWVSTSPTPLATSLASGNSYQGDEIDPSKENYVRIVYKDGTTKEGKLASSNSMIMWGEGGINIDFTTNSGEAVSFFLPKRSVGVGCDDPVKELSFAFWLK